MADFTLARARTTLRDRAEASAGRLLYREAARSQGVAQCAKKLGEEAIEAAIAAVAEDASG